MIIDEVTIPILLTGRVEKFLSVMTLESVGSNILIRLSKSDRPQSDRCTCNNILKQIFTFSVSCVELECITEMIKGITMPVTTVNEKVGPVVSLVDIIKK